MAVTIRDEQAGSVAVVAIDGRLDGAAAPQLDDHLVSAIGRGSALVLDLSGLDYVSSAGLRVLLKVAKQAKAAKKHLALAGITSAVKEVFDISGFTAIFAIHSDRAGAVAAVG